MDFLSLADVDGNPVELGNPDDAVTGVRRTTLAARLKALYGTVDKVDAFVGMISEPHLGHSELGALQRAIWARQFAALRDGDRFFYLNDSALGRIDDRYDISYRHTLAQIVELNTDTDVASDIFHAD
jgi:Animal haem peroxidase